jgi:hypothetical protein
VDAVKESALLELLNLQNITDERRSDLRRALESLYAEAWKRVELPGVTLTDAAVLRDKDAETGVDYQEVSISFKNSGNDPVSEVWGTYKVFDTAGKVIEEGENVRFFAAENTSQCVSPGESYYTPLGGGKRIKTKENADKCVVKVDRVVH